MTKAEEIKLYAAFLASLPRDSYLADLLADTLDPITAAIEQDTAMPGTITQLHEYKRQADEALRMTRAAINEASDALEEIERKTERTKRDAADAIRDANRSLDKIKDETRQLFAAYAR